LNSVKNELLQTKERLTNELVELRNANEKKVESQQEAINRLQVQHNETVALLDQTKEKLTRLAEENESNKLVFLDTNSTTLNNNKSTENSCH